MGRSGHDGWTWRRWVGGVVVVLVVMLAVVLAVAVDRALGAAPARVAASGRVADPVQLLVSVTAHPEQRVEVRWTVTCSDGHRRESSRGRSARTAPFTRAVVPPVEHPAWCRIHAEASLAGTGTVTVSLAAILA